MLADVVLPPGIDPENYTMDQLINAVMGGDAGEAVTAKPEPPAAKAAPTEAEPPAEPAAVAEAPEALPAPADVMSEDRIKAMIAEAVGSLRVPAQHEDTTQQAPVVTPAAREARRLELEKLLSNEELAQLREDLPEVDKVMTTLVAELNDLRGAVDAIVQSKEEAESAKVDAMIDSVPLLAQIRDDAAASEQGAAIWLEAVEVDKRLRASPIWANKSEAERFARVAEIMQADWGVTLRSAASTAAAPAATKPAAPVAKPTAKDKIAELKAAPLPTPATLNEIPGGGVQGSDNLNLAAMSPQELESLALSNPQLFRELAAKLGA